VTAVIAQTHAAGTSAQVLLQADIATRPLIHETAGALRGCGLRLFAAHVASDMWIVAIETAVNLYADGTAAFNGEVFEFAAPVRGRNAKPAAVEIDAIWVKSPDIDATAPGPGKAGKADDGHSLEYAIAAESAIAVMLSAMKGESILFGFRRSGNPAEHIYVGAAQPAGNDSQQLQRCIADLIK
jgi:hypothetical protein